MSSNGQNKNAVVLSGGGALGAYEVGVMKALFEGRSPATGYQPFDPQIYTGTSIGSFNAAFMLSRLEEEPATAVARLVEVWLEKLADQKDGHGNGVFRFRADFNELLDPSAMIRDPIGFFRRTIEDGVFLLWDGLQRLLHLLLSEGTLTPYRLVELLDFSSLFSTAPFTRTVEETIDFDSIPHSPKLLMLTTTNWTTGRLKMFDKHDMIPPLGPAIIKASSSIPGILPPSRLGAEAYVDGGVLMNTPLTPAIEAGAEVLHVVYLNPDINLVPLRDLGNLVGALTRSNLIQGDVAIGSEIERIGLVNVVLGLLDEIEDISEDVRRAHTESRQLDKDVADLTVGVSDILGQLRDLLGRKRRLSHYAPVTIHHHYPRIDLSGGPLGILNFDRDRIESLVRRGYSDALTHDCQSNKCLHPGLPQGRDGIGFRRKRPVAA